MVQKLLQEEEVFVLAASIGRNLVPEARLPEDVGDANNVEGFSEVGFSKPALNIAFGANFLSRL